LRLFHFMSGYFVKIRSFGEKLPNKSISIFISASFPWTSRMSKVDFDTGNVGE